MYKRQHLFDKIFWSGNPTGLIKSFGSPKLDSLNISCKNIYFNLNIFISILFASLVGEGSISQIYYADRIIDLPFALIAVAMSCVFIVSSAISKTPLEAA